MITALSVFVIISGVYFVFSDDIHAQLEETIFVTHTGAVISTTGEVLDPIYTSANMEFDPMEYLRDFDYGEVSTLPDGTTLREYTIIAEDDGVMEVAPGIFYNAWTYNGSVPGPQLEQLREI